MHATSGTTELDTLAQKVSAATRWEPAVSQYDDGSAHVVVFELPGVPEHSLCVRQTAQSLTVSGICPRRAVFSSEDDDVACGRFSCQVQTPARQTAEAGEVTLWRELLIIRLPK